jgi:hypothetical protein
VAISTKFYISIIIIIIIILNGHYTNIKKTTSHISKYLLPQSGYFMRFREGVVTII